MRLLVGCMKDGVVRFDSDQIGSSAQHLSSPVLTWTVAGVHLKKSDNFSGYVVEER